MKRLTSLFLLLFGCSTSAAEELEASLRQHVEAYYAAFDERRAEDIDPNEFNRGFGFRTFAARSPGSLIPESIKDWGMKKLLAVSFNQYEHYAAYIEEMNVEVVGDVGLVWGYHIEDFKLNDQPAEKVRVRFSATYKLEGKAWRPLISHRDIQPFDEEGDYIPKPPLVQ
jgi:hypothetical protein